VNERKYSGAHVAVVHGGLSRERDVSLVSGKAVEAALRARGYAVEMVDAGADLAERLAASRPDVVYNALHGTYGEDGRVQGLLDWMGIPYTGEGIRASLIAFDKGLAKMAYRQAGLPVAVDVILNASDVNALVSRRDAADVDGQEQVIRDAVPLAFPVFVKPTAEGSSVGVTMAPNPQALGDALAALVGVDVLIEDCVEGPEISVVCVGGRCLGSVEIEPLRSFYDYEAKYGEAGTRYHVPPRLDAPVIDQVEKLGLAAHVSLGCRGVTRSDLIVGAEGPVILETNTLPGMTPASLVPKVANSMGWSFEDLIEEILELAACGPEGEVQDGV
jgi:D-alanine-D-alanine ligase